MRLAVGAIKHEYRLNKKAGCAANTKRQYKMTYRQNDIRNKRKQKHGTVIAVYKMRQVAV